MTHVRIGLLFFVATFFYGKSSLMADDLPIQAELLWETLFLRIEELPWAIPILIVLLLLFGIRIRKRLSLKRARLRFKQQEAMGQRRRRNPLPPSPSDQSDTTAHLPLPPLSPAIPVFHADASRLPAQAPWVGRATQLAKLDEYRTDPTVAVVSVVAPSGIGKTTLLQTWAARIYAETEEKQRIFFYSPRAQEASRQALDSSIKDRAVLPEVLLLDDVESLREELDLNHYMTYLNSDHRHAAWANRLIVLVSDQKIGASAALPEGLSREIGLEALREKESIQLLHALGVKGKFADFRRLVYTLRGQPLALVLWGRLLSKYFGGQVAALDGVTKTQSETAMDNPIHALLDLYETLIWKDSHHSIFLQLMSMLDRPMADSVLQRLCQHTSLASPLRGVDASVLQALRTDLAEAGLLSARVEILHPLLRDYFRQKLTDENPDGLLQLRSMFPA